MYRYYNIIERMFISILAILNVLVLRDMIFNHEDLNMFFHVLNKKKILHECSCFIEIIKRVGEKR